jgi:RND family efflux transporter MFP subunit
MNRRMIARAAVSAALAVCGCEGAGKVTPVIEPPVVLVAEPVQREVTDFAEYPGRTDTPQQQDVRARVSGYIVEANFKEGREVKKGEVLYVIDPRPYQAALDVAAGQLEVARARAERATADLKRAEEQKKTPGVISQQEYDQYRAAKLEADAAVKAAEAQVESKRLDLGYTRVIAEQDGRVGRILYTVGNLVSAENLLTTIVAQDPIYVFFDLDENTVLRIQKLIREGKFRSARRHDDVPVWVGLANEPGQFPHAGRVNFVANRVDAGTGTLQVRAVLPNPEEAGGNRIFSAGLFVRVKLPLGEPRAALLISERAVGTDQGQKFVFVVNDKNEVVARPVTLGQSHGGLRVVESGLSAGERVIVSGVQRVRPGVTVAPKPGEMK